MVTTKLNLSMTEPSVRQIYAKQGDTGRVLDITLDQTPEDGTLRILRPDGTEVTSEAVTGGEVSESGETVSFESLTEADVTELTVGIEPVQDLHGYSYPWPAGGGKNLLPLTVDGIKSENAGTWVDNTYSNNGVTFTILTDNSGNVIGIQASGTATGSNASLQLPLPTNISVGDSVVLNGNPRQSTPATRIWVGTSQYADIAADIGLGTTFTYSESVAKIWVQVMRDNTVNGVIYTPMIRLSTETDATFSPYSNICPITWHDEVTVYDIGKNRALFANESNQDRASFTYESETANKIVATATTTAKFIGRYEAFLVKGVSYKALYTNKGASVAPYIYRDRLWGSLVRTVFSGEVFTVDTTQTYVIGIYTPSNSTYDIEDFMVIEASETDTAWTPYQGSTYTTSLGQTVYGGTLDMVSGVLTVDSRYLTVSDFRGWSGRYVSAGGLHWVGVSQTYPAGVNDDTSTNVCSHAPYSSNGNVAWKSTTPMFNVNASGYPARIYVASASLADFRTEYATLQAVYKLAEPQTYQLTPQQIKTLVGTNNVWASSGQIVNIKFTYGGLLSELPSDATSVVGKCYCDVEQNGVSSMPFTLNVKKNERES